MNALSPQRGVSYWGVLAMIAIAAVMIQFSVVAGQAYLDDMTINKTIEERLRATEGDQGGFEGKFLETTQAQMEMNNVRTLNAADIMTVEGSGPTLVIHKNYEVRKNFMGNMDLIIHFERVFDRENPAGKDVDKPTPANVANKP